MLPRGLSVQQRERLQNGRGRDVGRVLLELLERRGGRAVGQIRDRTHHGKRHAAHARRLRDRAALHLRRHGGRERAADGGLCRRAGDELVARGDQAAVHPLRADRIAGRPRQQGGQCRVGREHRRRAGVAHAHAAAHEADGRGVKIVLHQPVSHHDVADGEAACQPACDAGVDDRVGREPVDEYLCAARRADLADAAPDEHDLPRAQAARVKDQPLHGLPCGLGERRDERSELRIHGADDANPVVRHGDIPFRRRGRGRAGFCPP